MSSGKWRPFWLGLNVLRIRLQAQYRPIHDVRTKPRPVRTIDIYESRYMLFTS